MTNLKENPNTSLNTQAVNEQKKSSSQQTATPTSAKAQSSPQNSLGLRGRLLAGILPTALIPLVIGGGAGWWVIHESLEERYRDNLQKEALLAGEATSQVLSELQKIPEGIASNPLIISAVKEATQQVEAENLTRLKIEELEQQFRETKLLNPDTLLNSYLKNLAGPDRVTEMFVTEKYGLNVAYNQPTSDFVQRDEIWWQNGRTLGQWLGDLQYDESARRSQIESIHSITDPESGEFLGVIKMGIPSSVFDAVEQYLEYTEILDTAQVQVLDASTAGIFVTVTDQGVIQSDQVQGGEPITAMASAIAQGVELEETLLQTRVNAVGNQYNFKDISVQANIVEAGERTVQVSFLYDERNYEMTTVPNTDWVAVSSVEERILQNAGNELIGIFALVGAILGLAATGFAVWFARDLASPLTNVSEAALRAASGNLSARAEPEGSYETKVLAQSYNNLVDRVQKLLKEQEESVEQQRQEREELEEEVTRLMTDIEQAADGDLTVRAQLMEGDIGIVADLFNAVVENLQDTAQQVKVAASRVSSSLGENEKEIREVAEGAIAEAEEIQETLNSVEAMNRSIQEVAKNAQKAASIANTALFTAQEGNQAMDQTVESIQSLRATVGETSKKMKQMGESAQKISQVVSLIDEISLKTSLLAINASVEAHRAGELGQGFTAVAEQVEALAEQSASAAKEIAQIVATIQNETQEAIETMEQGTSEVVESSRSVEETKARLAEVVARSEEINNLMQSISDSTVSQAETSQAVSRLMEQVTASSQKRSETSKEVAQAIQETAQVAQSLEASVEQFKVEK
ncbi:MAG: HAMP domain-containing methyl-accepting chemotaxis protein [Halothece sp. Uz-M2-17]|nr:HAMP domain-containing methyl-accepting chemotaxis protein [Halothece sp. Uz-M2-17]